MYVPMPINTGVVNYKLPIPEGLKEYFLIICLRGESFLQSITHLSMINFGEYHLRVFSICEKDKTSYLDKSFDFGYRN